MVKVVRWSDYPGLSVWAQCNLKGLFKREAGRSSQGRRWDSGNRGWCDEL